MEKKTQSDLNNLFTSNGHGGGDTVCTPIQVNITNLKALLKLIPPRTHLFTKTILFVSTSLSPQQGMRDQSPRASEWNTKDHTY